MMQKDLLAHVLKNLVQFNLNLSFVLQKDYMKEHLAILFTFNGPEI